MIRPARPDDATAIAAIWNPLIRDTLVTFNAIEKPVGDIAAMIADKATQGHAFLVVEREGAIAGFATYGQFRGGVGYRRTMEHTIILGSSARGQGVGRKLLGAIEDHARAADAHSIFAGVSGGNPEGRDFHAAMGYHEAAILPAAGFKFGRWFDLVLMQKFLD